MSSQIWLTLGLGLEGYVAKRRGTKNFSAEEGQRLADLAAQGLTKVEAARALSRSYWVVMRHGKRLGLAFAPPPVRPRVLKNLVNPELAKLRAQRRQLEDLVIQELARSGWSAGLGAVELDLDFSQLGRHSRRLGVKWTRYPNRSVRGAPVSGLADLRRLRGEGARADSTSGLDHGLYEAGVSVVVAWGGSLWCLCSLPGLDPGRP